MPNNSAHMIGCKYLSSSFYSSMVLYAHLMHFRGILIKITASVNEQLSPGVVDNLGLNKHLAVLFGTSSGTEITCCSFKCFGVIVDWLLRYNQDGLHIKSKVVDCCSEEYEVTAAHG